MIPSGTSFIHFFCSVWIPWYMCIAVPWGRHSAQPSWYSTRKEPGGGVESWIGERDGIVILCIARWYESSNLPQGQRQVFPMRRPTPASKSRFSFRAPLFNELTTACCLKTSYIDSLTSRVHSCFYGSALMLVCAPSTSPYEFPFTDGSH